MIVTRLVQIAVLSCSLGMLGSVPVAAQAPSVERVEVVEYGTYSAERQVLGRDRHGIGQATASNIEHVATTREIPARIGTTFGFRYKIMGRPADAQVALRRVVVFPAPGLQPRSSSKPLPRDEFALEAKIGETNDMFYTLEDEFELVPGTWIIEIWYRNRKLSSESFTVSTADDSAPARPDAGLPVNPEGGAPAKPGAGLPVKPDRVPAKPDGGAPKKPSSSEGL